MSNCKTYLYHNQTLSFSFASEPPTQLNAQHYSGICCVPTCSLYAVLSVEPAAAERPLQLQHEGRGPQGENQQVGTEMCRVRTQIIVSSHTDILLSEMT